MVEKIDKDSTQLAEALKSRAPIIITTLQKFPFVTEKIDEQASFNFTPTVGIWRSDEFWCRMGA